MKFGFIAKQRNIWPVVWLCKAMGVSGSGFHAWLNRSPSAGSRRDESASMTAQLVADALLMAVWRRGKLDALMHHSDRGSQSAQYASEQFQRPMADSGIVCSMSRSGNVWDNAAIKTERANCKTYRTRNEARADVFE
jgi:transposase InsO family protein